MMHKGGKKKKKKKRLVLLYYPDSIFVSWGVLMAFAHDRGRGSRFGGKLKTLSLDKQSLEIIT